MEEELKKEELEKEESLAENSQNSAKEEESSEELTLEQLKEKNKQLFARAKKAEEKYKRIEAELLALKQELGKYKLGSKEREEIKEKIFEKEKELSSAYDLVKTVAVLKDYSPKEIEYILEFSQKWGINPEEAVAREDVQSYLRHLKEKVVKEQATPPPSAKTSIGPKPFEEWTEEDLRKASLEEIEKFRKWAKERGKQKGVR